MNIGIGKFSLWIKILSRLFEKTKRASVAQIACMGHG
jgi:hypothetical protein